MKKNILFTCILFIAIFTSAFILKPKSGAEEGGIKWMTWHEVQEAQKKQPRKVVVDVYTAWCGWCKRMDATTFTNPEIIKFVNENFYAVKFDAETREVINFKNKDYKFVADGGRGSNELAQQILNNQMSYPTSVYFDENMNEIWPVPGYLEPKTFEQVINYVHSNNYKTMSFAKFQEEFKGKVQ